MKTDRELMQQALDDLMSCSGAPHWPVFQPTITALRERLAKPEMQPCAGRNCGSTNPDLHSAECFEDYEKATGMAQPEQEPMAVYGYCPTCGAKGVSRERHPDGNDRCANDHAYNSKDALTTPPAAQRQWVGLTDDAIEALLVDWPEDGIAFFAFARAIEAKLKEKNT